MRKITGRDQLEGLSHDAGLSSIAPTAAYQADTEEEVVRAIDEARESGLAVTARGGGTAIPTQSVGGGALLIQLRRRVSVSPTSAVCEPGVVKSDLNSLLLPSGTWMPVDPSSYASCTVGGMVANNASGARTLKYGSTIDYVERLRAVFPGGGAVPLAPMPMEEALSGELRLKGVASLLLENQKAIAEERPLVTKNSSGYRLERLVHDGTLDLPKLLAGSEGTLGVVTEATLRLLPRPGWKLLLVAESSLGGLGDVVESFRRLKPSVIEMVDKSVYRLAGERARVSRYSRGEEQYLIFCELDGEGGDPSRRVEDVVASDAAGLDPLVFSSPSDIADAWEARNGSLVAAQEMRKGGRRPVPGVEDLVVPPASLKELVKLLSGEFDRRGLEYIIYGHAGDANLHARPFLDPSSRRDMAVLKELMEECFEAVWRMRGSMTAEHGDGMLRAEFVEGQYPKTFWIMKELKGAFDPKGVLNPGVKLPK